MGLIEKTEEKQKPDGLAFHRRNSSALNLCFSASVGVPPSRLVASLYWLVVVGRERNKKGVREQVSGWKFGWQGGGLLVIIARADLIRHQCIELFCITCDD